MKKIAGWYSSVLLLAALCTGTALAAGAGGGGGDMSDPVIQRAQAAFATSDWATAQAVLKEALLQNDKSADYHNLYAYSIRKAPSPGMDLVFKHYADALRIDPRHLDAHEYIGEAYLMVNKPDKAREHLAVLDKLCIFGCEEYTDLKKAIKAYDASHR